MIQGWLYGCVLVTMLSLPSVLFADSSRILEVGRFSTEPVGHTVPNGWKPLLFKKITRYTTYELIIDGDTVVVKARSDASASGLTREVRIDPRDYPIVRWRWKIDHLLMKSDVSRKEGDDYPARLYITFEYDPTKVDFIKKLKYKAGQVLFGPIPIGALNYIWEGKTQPGTIVDNAYTDFAKMIVVRSGSQDVGRWMEEERNIYEDYKLAFGEEPPMINGVAIMTDTDNTKESATAYYGDILFRQSSKE